MKRIFILALSAVMVGCAGKVETPVQSDLAKLVDPLIGTDGPGNVYPGAQAPFGFVQLSPDNGLSGWDRIAGYFYPDSTIAGFSHTHLSGTGAGDLYDISFMPAVAPFNIAKGELGLHSKFSHSQEEAWAGFYKVLLADYDIEVELTATTRVGAQRYTFNRASDSALIKLDLFKSMNWDFPMGADIEVIDSVTIRGERRSNGWAADQRVYFYTTFSKPFKSYTIEEKFTKHDNKNFNDLRSENGFFYFDVTAGERIEVLTAISGTSMEGAQANMQGEAAGKNFDAILAETSAKWNDQLSKIAITGGTPAQQTTFYTSLYRTMIAPVVYSDVNGEYMGVDRQIHKGEGERYTIFSLWDTYRAEHPLLVMLEGKRVEDMVRSMVGFYNESGALPVWNIWGNETDMMIGNHAIPVIAEALIKGVDMDAKAAFEAVEASANRNQRGQQEHREKGYISADSGEIESVSKSLEYAYDDFAVAMMARKMNELFPSEGYDSIANEFLARSKYYENIYNEQSRFFEPRKANGQWVGEFNPDVYTHHFTESNAWHYRFLQHDIAGQIAMMGGAQNFEQALDDIFLKNPAASDSLPIFSTGMIGQYVHGNEPSHHVAFLYNHIGRRDKTIEYVDSIRNNLYSERPEGICGNEDCGQMSAWYVFSAMGFYPVDPVSGVYELASPLFDQMSVRLSNGNTLTVKKEGNGAGEIFFAGNALGGNTISWGMLKEGGELIFKNK